MKSLSIMVFVICSVATFARGVSVRRSSSGTLAEGPPCPIPDPLFDAGPTPINATLHPLLELLEGSFLSDLKAEGLSSLKYKYEIKLLPPGITLELEIGEAKGNATFQADGYIDARPFREETIPSGNITGKGFGQLAVRKLAFKGRANMVVFGRLVISSLTADYMRFEDLDIDLGKEITIGGKQIDWAELSKNIKENFDKDFAAHKTTILNKIRAVANSIIGEFTLQELLDLHRELVDQECD